MRTLPDFADLYRAARAELSRDLMLEVVGRNSDDEGFYHPSEEPSDEFVRRIIATYLAVTRAERG